MFALLLLCLSLNQDKNLSLNNAKDPFVAPLGTSFHVGDINTGCCYRTTYKTLVKEIGVYVSLPCVMAMDKTRIDMAGQLQMEPIILSHGLLKHVVLLFAIRILGYMFLQRLL